MGDNVMQATGTTTQTPSGSGSGSDAGAGVGVGADAGAGVGVGVGLERRGRRWLLWSFLACPCHLPLTLALLGGVFGGTVLGALLREYTVLAGVIITATWLAGTARGLVLVRRAERGELVCALPQPGKRRWLPGRR